MSESAEMSVSVAELDAGGKEYSFALRPAWVRGALEGCDATATDREGKVEVRLSASGRDVVAIGHVDAELEVACARCTKPAKVSISHDFSIMFVPEGKGATKGDDEETVGSEEADTMPFDGETVVLDDFIRDELLLETPMFPLCSEACPGMSPSPGEGADASSDSAQAKVDPRLLPLLRWKTQQKS